jgi:hypothetical protein
LATVVAAGVGLVAVAGADPSSLISAPPLVAPLKASVAEELPSGAPALADELDPTVPPATGALDTGRSQTRGPEAVGPRHHPWGSFDVGAWRSSRITSESFDASGALVGRSVTARTERLVRKGAETVTLAYETVVEVSGKRLPGPHQEVTTDLWTDEAVPDDSPAAQGQRLPDAVISLRKRPIECQVWAFTTPLDRGERLHTVWYAPAEVPSVLRHEQVDLIDGGEASRERRSVTRRRVATPLAGGIVEAYFVSIDRELAGGGRIEAYGAHVPGVPGGVLNEGVTEFDAAGQRVRWTTTELVNWGATAADRQAGIASAPSANGVDGVGASPDPAASPTPPAPRDTRPRRLLRLLRRGEIYLESQGILDSQGLLAPLEGPAPSEGPTPPAPTTEAPPFDPAAEGGEGAEPR